MFPLDALKQYQIYFPRSNSVQIITKYNGCIAKALEHQKSSKGESSQLRVKLKKIAHNISANSKAHMSKLLADQQSRVLHSPNNRNNLNNESAKSGRNSANSDVNRSNSNNYNSNATG